MTLSLALSSCKLLQTQKKAEPEHLPTLLFREMMRNMSSRLYENDVRPKFDISGFCYWFISFHKCICFNTHKKTSMIHFRWFLKQRVKSNFFSRHAITSWLVSQWTGLSFIFINLQLGQRYSQIEVIKVQKPHTALRLMKDLHSFHCMLKCSFLN